MARCIHVVGQEMLNGNLLDDFLYREQSIGVDHWFQADLCALLRHPTL